MRQSLLALFRSSDGRSLARALALLLFVSAIAGQLPGGFHAAGGEAPVFCSIAADASVPSSPAGNGFAPCCLAICAGSLAPMLAATAPAVAAIRHVTATLPQPNAIEVAAATDAEFPFGPRGPPLLG